ncbi:hypothetical protein C8J57DRAFT_1250990 [Mycena rebaudengoi]|nr:hypothetical protein C8J57DRAFT_1250990 [Mycena rebaudengoi]
MRAKFYDADTLFVLPPHGNEARPAASAGSEVYIRTGPLMTILQLASGSPGSLFGFSSPDPSSSHAALCVYDLAASRRYGNPSAQAGRSVQAHQAHSETGTPCGFEATDRLVIVVSLPPLPPAAPNLSQRTHSPRSSSSRARPSASCMLSLPPRLPPCRRSRTPPTATPPPAAAPLPRPHLLRPPGVLLRVAPRQRSARCTAACLCSLRLRRPLALCHAVCRAFPHTTTTPSARATPHAHTYTTPSTPTGRFLRSAVGEREAGDGDDGRGDGGSGDDVLRYAVEDEPLRTVDDDAPLRTIRDDVPLRTIHAFRVVGAPAFSADGTWVVTIRRDGVGTSMHVFVANLVNSSPPAPLAILFVPPAANAGAPSSPAAAPMGMQDVPVLGLVRQLTLEPAVHTAALPISVSLPAGAARTGDGAGRKRGGGGDVESKAAAGVGGGGREIRRAVLGDGGREARVSLDVLVRSVGAAEHDLPLAPICVPYARRDYHTLIWRYKLDIGDAKIKGWRRATLPAAASPSPRATPPPRARSACAPPPPRAPQRLALVLPQLHAHPHRGGGAAKCGTSALAAGGASVLRAIDQGDEDLVVPPDVVDENDVFLPVHADDGLSATASCNGEDSVTSSISTPAMSAHALEAAGAWGRGEGGVDGRVVEDKLAVQELGIGDASVVGYISVVGARRGARVHQEAEKITQQRGEYIFLSVRFKFSGRAGVPRNIIASPFHVVTRTRVTQLRLHYHGFIQANRC